MAVFRMRVFSSLSVTSTNLRELTNLQTPNQFRDLLRQVAARDKNPTDAGARSVRRRGKKNNEANREAHRNQPRETAVNKIDVHLHAVRNLLRSRVTRGSGQRDFSHHLAISIASAARPRDWLGSIVLRWNVGRLWGPYISKYFSFIVLII